MKRSSSSPVFSFLDIQELYTAFLGLIRLIQFEHILEKHLILLKILFYFVLAISLIVFLHSGSLLILIWALLLGALVYLYNIVAGLIIGNKIFYSLRAYMFKSVEIIKGQDSTDSVRFMKNAQMALSKQSYKQYKAQTNETRYNRIKPRLSELLSYSAYRLYPLTIKNYEDYNKNIYTPSVLWRLFPNIMLKRHWDYRHFIQTKRLEETRMK